MFKPHIIYIFSDEHCGQATSHMGDAHVQTPWADRLAYLEGGNS